MFLSFNTLTLIQFNNIDTSKVTDMGIIFFDCSLLTSLNLSCFDTSSVRTMENMFYNCKNLKSIFIGENFEIPEKSTNMSYNCLTQVQNFYVDKIVQKNFVNC